MPGRRRPGRQTALRVGALGRLFWLCGLALGLAGCAGYKLGPTTGFPAGAKSIQVNLFRNETSEPRLIEAVGSALRKNLQQDGAYRLDTHGEGDIVIGGVITAFDRIGVSFQPADVLTVQDYTLTLTAHITARERATGKVLLDTLVKGATTLRVGANLSSAERQAVPMLADDLAKKATTLLVNGLW